MGATGGKGFGGKSAGVAHSNGQVAGGSITSAVEMPGVTDRRFSGVVKSLKDQKFGFLTCEELQEIDSQDIFVHWTNLQGFTVGSEVSFAVVVNDKGGFKAVDLQD